MHNILPELVLAANTRDNILVVLLLIGGVAAIFGVYAFQGAYFKKAGRGWAMMASRLGLRYRNDSETGTVFGKLQGFKVQVELEVHGSGRHRSYFTHVSLRLPRSLGLELHVQPRNILGRLGNLFGKEIAFKDTEFTKHYIVGARERKAARQLLDDGLRKLLRDYARSFKGLVIQDRELSWKTQTTVTDTKKLSLILKAQVRIAGHLFPESVEADEQPSSASRGRSAKRRRPIGKRALRTRAL